MLLPLFILPGLIKRLKILGGSGHGNFSLGFVPAMVFYCSLNLDLVCVDVGGPDFSEDLLISLPYIGIKS